MKNLLLLGFVGVASARDCYTTEMDVEGCGTTATFSAHGGFYYCLDPAPCPAGWATAELGTAIGDALGEGHCYLMHSTLPDSDVATICADTSGDFCPVGQSPFGGECQDDNENEVGGCTDDEADNYSADATDDDGSCVYTGLCAGLETHYRSKCGCGI